MHPPSYTHTIKGVYIRCAGRYTHTRAWRLSAACMMRINTDRFPCLKLMIGKSHEPVITIRLCAFEPARVSLLILKLCKKKALSPHSCLHHLLRLHIFESWEHYDVIILHDNKKANLEYDSVGNSSLTNVFINWQWFKHMCIFVDVFPSSYLSLKSLPDKISFHSLQYVKSTCKCNSR